MSVSHATSMKVDHIMNCKAELHQPLVPRVVLGLKLEELAGTRQGIRGGPWEREEEGQGYRGAEPFTTF